MNSIEKILSELYSSMYNYSLLEITFNKQKIYISRGVNKGENLISGKYKVFVIKSPKNERVNNIIFHVADNPIKYFSFPINAWYGTRSIGKQQIFDESTKFYEKAYADFSVDESILFTFNMISDDGSPYRLTLDFIDLIDSKTTHLINEIEGLNIVDDYYFKK